MKHAAIVLYLGLCVLPAARAEEVEDEWPRLIRLEGDVRLVLYSPQINSWKNFEVLDAWMAATVEYPTEGGAFEEALGSIRLRSGTEVDHARGVVRIEEPEVVEIRFPTLDDAGRALIERVVRKAAEVGAEEVPLQDLISEVTPPEEDPAAIVVDHTPPKLIVSRKPAILISFDGEPVLAPIEGTDLLLAMNTPSLLFQQRKTGWWYLFGWESWIKTRDLKSGKWVPAPRLPSAFKQLPDDSVWGPLRKNVPGKPLDAAAVPRVFVATEPTELFVFFGEPTFQPVPGTSLTYVDNTEGDVFLNAKDGNYYVLISGRWYRTRAADQPLEFCTTALPVEFANIPPDHPAGRVRASVPGTDEARDALVSARLPREATIQRGEIDIEVTFAGPPRFEPIARTQVRRCVNTSLDVFQVADRYYCCIEAIWFVSTSTQGPWKLCESVPAAFWSIPPQNPAHNVTYARVVRSDEKSVTYAYTPGYFGCFVDGDVVVWGTGFESGFPADYWVHGWTAHRYWFERWRKEELHQWHRHVTFGCGAWYDPISGLYRASYDVLSHAKIRTHRAESFRTWRGKAVLPIERREPQPPKPEPIPASKPVAADPKPQVVQGRADLYAGPKGEVYKKAHGSWYKQKPDGKWVHLSRKPLLKEEYEKRMARAARSRERSASKRNRRYRSSYGRRGIAFYSRRPDLLPLRGVSIGGTWGGVGWGGGDCGGAGIGFGGW